MDAEELKLERQRLRMETSLRRADQKLQRDQFRAGQANSGGWRSITTPTGAAIAAALLGICGTAASKFFDLEIERNRQETNVILRASEVPPDLPEDSRAMQRARNLLWFNDAGYLHLPQAYREQLFKQSGLQVGAKPPSPAINSVTNQLDKANFALAQRFLKNLGRYDGEENGEMDKKLSDAVLKFQKDYHLDEDGYPGAQTIRKMFDLYESKLKEP